MKKLEFKIKNLQISIIKDLSLSLSYTIIIIKIIYLFLY